MARDYVDVTRAQASAYPQVNRTSRKQHSVHQMDHEISTLNKSEICSIVVSSVEVRYMDERLLLDRFDAIRGIPSLPRKEDQYVHRIILDGLCSRSAEERIACLDVFLVISLRETDEMEMLDVMVDDPDPKVRNQGERQLIDTAPIFPSALRDTIARLVRSENVRTQ